MRRNHAFLGIGELAQRMRHLAGERARGKLAHLVAADATVVLHRVEPLALGYFGRDSALAAKFARLRNLEHGIPINRRIVFRRGGLVRRHHRLEVRDLARASFNFRRIDKPIAAYPNVVVGFGQIWQHVASLIVGDHHFGKPGGKVGGFRDHPDAGFGPLRAGDHAADVIAVDADLGAAALLAANRDRRSGDESYQAKRKHANLQEPFRFHNALL